MDNLKELKEASLAVMAGIEYCAKNLADGFDPWSDGLAAIKLAPTFKRGLEGLNKIPSELLAATPEMRADYIAWFEQNFDLENDKAEFWIEKTLRIIDSVYELVREKKS